MNLLLSEDFPLRTTAALGDYSEDAILPVVYGDLSQSACPLVKLTEYEYLAADHPATVTALFVDGQETQGWAASHRTGQDGRTYCLVTVSAPAPSGSTLSAAMRGKRDPATGALIEHPADILTDLLAQTGKRWDLSRLKAELPGVRLANRMDKMQSVRAWIDEITRSCGVVWAERFAAIYPAAAGVTVAALDARSAKISNPLADIADCADHLRIAFDWHPGKSAFAQYMEFSANPSPFGVSGSPVASIEAPWLRQASDAEGLGQRLLSRLARPRGAVVVETGKDIRVGDWVTVSNRSLPIDGPLPMMALSLETQPGKAARTITGEISWGDDPIVTLVHHARAIRHTSDDGVDVSYANGVDDQGKPMQNASVSLDGAAPKKTNAQGQVKFAASPGAHTLYVLATGFVPFEMEITL